MACYMHINLGKIGIERESMLLFEGFILGIITMLVVFSPVIKAITKSKPPKHTDINENEYVFYDIPNDDA